MDKRSEKWKEKIPKHWEVKKLGDEAKILMGQSPPSSSYNSESSGLPFFQGKAEFTHLHPVAVKWCDKPGKIADPLDILVSVRAPVGAVNIANSKCCIGRGLAAIRIENHRFLFYFIKLIGKELDKQGTGTTFKAISGQVLRSTPIPIPPLREQEAIVAKIEELFSELDKGKEQLEIALAQLKVYRQSLLQAAFSGKLTHSDVKEGELPEGWMWVKLGDVCETCLGKMLDKKKNKGLPKPYLRNISVRWGEFDLSNLETMKFEAHEEERFSLKNNDLVVCEGGEPGRCAIWKNQIADMKIQKALHRVRVSKNLSVYFLFYFFKKSAITGNLEKYFTGTTIKHLTGQGLKKILIPLASIQEQEEIVQILESKLTVCDKMEETIKQSLKQCDVLRQSILKKAFEGSLVGSVVGG